MKKKGWIAAALALAAFALLKRRPSTYLSLKFETSADPDLLLDLVSQVEREPEFIPLVSFVSLESDENDEKVYRVHAKIVGLSPWARFRKRIHRGERRAEWTTLSGFLGFRQNGSLEFRRRGETTDIALVAETSFPRGIGAFLAPLSLPILACQFQRWITNLIAEERRNVERRMNAENTGVLS
jgi:hypothetical protein